MKRFQLYLFVLAATIVSGVAGCSNGDEDSTPMTSKYYAETPELFLVGQTDGRRDAECKTEGMRASMVYNDDYRVADVWIYGIDFGDGEGKQTLTIEDAAWEFSVGSPTIERVIDLPSVAARSTEGNELVLANFHFVYFQENELDSRRCRGVYFTFDYEGRHFTAYPRHLYCEGTTVSTSGSDRTVSYDSNFTIDFDVDGSMATVTVDKVVLKTGTTVGPFVMADLKAVFVEGGYKIESDGSFTDSDCVVTGFSATGDMEEELVVEMTIGLDGTDYRIKSHLKPNFYDTPTVETGK